MTRFIRALTALTVVTMAACGNDDAATVTTPAASTRAETTTVPATSAVDASDLKRVVDTAAALDALTTQFRVGVPAVKLQANPALLAAQHASDWYKSAPCDATDEPAQVDMEAPGLIIDSYVVPFEEQLRDMNDTVSAALTANPNDPEIDAAVSAFNDKRATLRSEINALANEYKGPLENHSYWEALCKLSSG
jgi:hypothetical protein